MFKGVIGAVIGGLIGAAVWAAVTYFTGYELGFVAWIVGGIVGLGMGVLAKDDANTATGVIAALVAVGAVALGKFGAIHFIIEKETAKMLASEGPVTMEDAKIIMADQLVEEYERAGKTLTWAEGMSMQDATTVADYPADLQKDLEVRWAAAPAETQEQYRQTYEHNRTEGIAAFKSEIRDSAFKESFGLFDILWLVLAVGTAFKLGAGLDND
ncbi:MAG TPA: hypothetical protein VK157_12595 [Phycisphaerales bacterium]|nr:hypothetical protein [Phycisphaerales bacterium]